MVMSVSMASLLLSWMASTDAVTSIAGLVSGLPSSLHHASSYSALQHACALIQALHRHAHGGQQSEKGTLAG